MMEIEILINVSSLQKTPDINLDITKTFPHGQVVKPWTISMVIFTCDSHIGGLRDSGVFKLTQCCLRTVDDPLSIYLAH